MRGDEYIRLGLDFAQLQIAVHTLERIDLSESEVPLQDDFKDALNKLVFIQDVMYEMVVEELINGLNVGFDKTEQNEPE